MGPQSQADAYEVLAYREKRRRESASETASVTPRLVQDRNTKGNRLLFSSPSESSVFGLEISCMNHLDCIVFSILAIHLEWKDQC